MRNILLNAFLALVGCLVAATFGAMMTVPEPVALANLKTYSQSFGLAPRTGFFLGLSIAAIGLMRLALRLRNRKSSGHAIVEASRIINSAIEDNYSEWPGSAVNANVIRGSSVRRNILKKPGENADE